MPSLFRIGKYLVFFWSNENEEPIHVHVSEGRPTPNATKLWLTSKGGCIIANNNSRIPNHDLADIMDVIEAQFFFICKAWRSHFVVDNIKFFC